MEADLKVLQISGIFTIERIKLVNPSQKNTCMKKKPSSNAKILEDG